MSHKFKKHYLPSRIILFFSFQMVIIMCKIFCPIKFRTKIYSPPNSDQSQRKKSTSSAIAVRKFCKAREGRKLGKLTKLKTEAGSNKNVCGFSVKWRRPERMFINGFSPQFLTTLIPRMPIVAFKSQGKCFSNRRTGHLSFL